MHVLLHVLSRRPDAASMTPEQVSAAHRRVRSGLLFLSRMGVVNKFSSAAAAESAAGPTDSDAEEDVLEAPPAKKFGADKSAPRDFSKNPKNMAKKASIKEANKTNAKEKKKLKKKKKKGVSSEKAEARKQAQQARQKEGAQQESPLSKRPPRKMKLSPKLSELLGGQRELSRQDVLRGVWRYVKERQLQHPKKRTVIVCDEGLRKVAKKKKIAQTEVMGMLDRHLKPLSSGKARETCT